MNALQGINMEKEGTVELKVGLCLWLKKPLVSAQGSSLKASNDNQQERSLSHCPHLQSMVRSHWILIKWHQSAVSSSHPVFLISQKRYPYLAVVSCYDQSLLPPRRTTLPDVIYFSVLPSVNCIKMNVISGVNFLVTIQEVLSTHLITVILKSLSNHSGH